MCAVLPWPDQVRSRPRGHRPRRVRIRHLLGSGDVAAHGLGGTDRARGRVGRSRSRTSPGRRARRSAPPREAHSPARRGRSAVSHPERLLPGDAGRREAGVKLLVANRGEIAVRVFRTCRRLGIGTVAVAAPDDLEAMHVRSQTRWSRSRRYLDAAEHLRAAEKPAPRRSTPAMASLPKARTSPRTSRRQDCLRRPDARRALRAGGDKIDANGSHARPAFRSSRTGEPEEVGFPLVVKAAAGGGGRGMRVVRSREELEDALAAARREAQVAFGDDRVFCERYVERPRHVEIQVLADGRGAIYALGERECSIQRRHQKVLEESPPPRSTTSCERQ